MKALQKPARSPPFFRGARFLAGTLSVMQNMHYSSYLSLFGRVCVNDSASNQIFSGAVVQSYVPDEIRLRVTPYTKLKSYIF